MQKIEIKHLGGLCYEVLVDGKAISGVTHIEVDIGVNEIPVVRLSVVGAVDANLETEETNVLITEDRLA